jgi:hypothetical protein
VSGTGAKRLAGESGAAMLVALCVALGLLALVFGLIQVAALTGLMSRAQREAMEDAFRLEAALGEFLATSVPLPRDWVAAEPALFASSLGDYVSISVARLSERAAADGSRVRDFSVVARAAEGRGNAVAVIVRDSVPPEDPLDLGPPPPVELASVGSWFVVVQ